MCIARERRWHIPVGSTTAQPFCDREPWNVPSYAILTSTTPSFMPQRIYRTQFCRLFRGIDSEKYADKR